MRSENEARILYTVEKGIIFKGAHFEKNRAALRAANSLSIILAALRATQHGLYPSNSLPTPMDYKSAICTGTWQS